MDLGLTDRAFVVTAASTGLGRATAQQLVAEGARVVLVARRAELLAEAVSRLGPDRAVALAADLTDANTADTACALALDAFGRLDGALISVGGPPAGTVLGTSEQQWRGAFEAVFLAALRVSSAVLRNSTSQDVCIAWVLSTSVKMPIHGLAASNGLRPGLAMLVKQLADELGPQGARIVGLMPGGSRPSASSISTRSTMIRRQRGQAQKQRFRCADQADPRSSAGLRRSCFRLLRPISPAR